MLLTEKNASRSAWREDHTQAKNGNKTAVLMNFQNATMLEGNVDNAESLHKSL
ncbi:MAG: hypothetical protein WD795_15610 [Woeseia sp.]